MANEDQAKYWAETAGQRWLANEQLLEASSRPFGIAAIDAADVKPGERILDVGCGFGPTAIELARRTGPSGAVVGLDISPLLLGRAKEKAAEAGVDNVTFVEADAQTADIPGAYDLLFSRFGIMFFDDPVAAFTNLFNATATPGRLTVVCWRDAASNPWMSSPVMAAAPILGPLDPPPPGAPGPGPFRYADADILRSELAHAGFADIQIDPFDTTMDTKVDELDNTLEFVLRMGPFGDKYNESEPEVRDQVLKTVREAAAQYESGGEARIPAAAWIVRAKKR
jgi:SAM-dependent methyltransferase